MLSYRLRRALFPPRSSLSSRSKKFFFDRGSKYVSSWLLSSGFPSPKDECPPKHKTARAGGGRSRAPALGEARRTRPRPSLSALEPVEDVGHGADHAAPDREHQRVPLELLERRGLRRARGGDEHAAMSACVRACVRARRVGACVLGCLVSAQPLALGWPASFLLSLSGGGR